MRVHEGVFSVYCLLSFPPLLPILQNVIKGLFSDHFMSLLPASKADRFPPGTGGHLYPRSKTQSSHHTPPKVLGEMIRQTSDPAMHVDVGTLCDV